MMAFQKWRRAIAVSILLVFAPMASACFGSFQLTRKVYKFNRGIASDKWIRWIAFLAMNFIPVYWFAALVDAVFANSVEFWTGSNPLARIEPQTVVGPNGELARLTPVEGGAALTVIETSGAEHRMTLLREAPGVIAAYDADGVLVSRLTGFGSDSPQITEVVAR